MTDASKKFRHVASPVRIGSVQIKNRIVSSAHVTNFGANGISERFINYHRARAEGGAGLICLEAGSVHQTSPGALNLSSDGIVDGYRRLKEALAPFGTCIFQQLWHGGFTKLPADGSAPFSASSLPGPTHGIVARAMSEADIEPVVEAFAEAASRAQAGGLDGVEVHGAHTYLLQQFLSPLTNHREDRYGGSFENRLRLMRQVLAAVRERVGRDFAVGIRLSPEGVPGGLTAEDNVKVVERLQEAELVDFFSFSYGGYHAFERMIGGMHEASGYELATSGVMGSTARLPRIATGRILSLNHADRLIADGQADLISMTRALIADPDLPRKTLSGSVSSVRPCVGCNQYCIGGLYGTRGSLGCAVNPQVGDERPSTNENRQENRSKHVIVVGGGPAGMEAARVAALRGCEVTLFEARNYLGGTLELARRAPTRGSFGDFITWHTGELRRLGVTLRLSVCATAKEILEERPDAVVLATGATPRLNGWQVARPGRKVPGIDAAHVISSNELFGADRDDRPIKAAVVYDDVGHYEGIAAAEYLAERGAAVTFVTRHASFAPLMEPALMAVPALKRLRSRRFRLYVRCGLDAIRESECDLSYLDGGDPFTVAAEVVVFINHNRPNRDLLTELADKVAVTPVGDARTPRYLEGAIHDGYRAAMEL